MMPEEDRAELGEMSATKPAESGSRSSIRLRRAGLPAVSGKVSVLVLVLCFLLAAIIVMPLAKRWPLWIEAELVVAAWWLIWAATLAYLLHRGQRVTDDHTLGPPRSWWPSKSNSSGADLSGCFPEILDFGWFGDLGGVGGEAC